MEESHTDPCNLAHLVVSHMIRSGVAFGNDPLAMMIMPMCVTPRYMIQEVGAQCSLVTNLVTNLSPNLVTNLVIAKFSDKFSDEFGDKFSEHPIW